ncbi:MAG: glycosyltransferase family 39 protein [bacterium]|nr:glycosyltransferase family 39 protein [bacterium]
MGKGKGKIILILLLGLVLRLVNLNQSFWLDEGAQLLMSQKSLGFIWSGRSADFQPPFFYFLVHFWMMLSHSEIILRILPALFGLATIYIVYLIGKKMFDEKIALLSSLFLAISPYHIYYSQELRMYSLLAFLGTLSIYFLLQKKWFFYTASCILLIYTHYAGIFLLFSQALWIAFRQRNSLKKYFFSSGMIFLFYLPWLPQFFKQLQSGGNLVKILPDWRNVANLDLFLAIPLTLDKFIIGRITFDNKIFYLILSLLVFAGCFSLLHILLKKKSLERIFLLVWFIVPILTAIFVSLFIPQYQPFRLLFTIVPFYLIISVAIFAFPKKFQICLLAIIILFSFYGLGEYYFNARFQREDWRGAVEFVEAQDSTESVALFEFSAPFASYDWYSVNKVKAIGVLPGLSANQEFVDGVLPLAVENRNRIFLFQYLQPLTDPKNLVDKWLTDHGFVQKKTNDFSGVGFVYEFNRI